MNINFAPVADVNNNPANPIIGARSFGDESASVARFVAAQTRGYQRAGVAATLKHFPGHGDTATDSHLALPAVPFERARLDAVELPPFRAGIAAGAAAVMTAHIALPALTGSPGLPATLAPEVIVGLLREELGFQGVVITDSLEMAAISRAIDVAAAAPLALRAGVDIALVSHNEERQRAALAAIRQVVEDGALPRAALIAGVERVLALKRRFLSWEAVDGSAHAIVGSPAHRALARRAYERAVTLVRDEDGVIPLRLASGERVGVLTWAAQERSQVVDALKLPDSFGDALARWFPAVVSATLTADAPAEEARAAFQRVTEAEVIVLVTRNASLNPASMETMRDAVLSARAAGRRVIGVATGVPYDAALFPEIGSWLATYDESGPALEAAARVLAGELAPTGRLPVTLPLPAAPR